MKVKAIDILKKIKESVLNMKFDDMPAPAPVTTISKTTADGVEVTVDKFEVGGVATINGMPAPANTYTFTDGTSLTCDATGVITAVTAAQVTPPAPIDSQAAPAAPAPAPAAPAPTQQAAAPQKYSFKEEDKSAEGIDKLFAQFATGTPEERILNLETVCKALMEYSFGWELRQAKEKQDRDAAIKVYTESLLPVNQAMAAQKKTIEEQGKIIKEMVGLIDEFVNEPNAENLEETKKTSVNFSTTLAKTRKGIGKYAAALEEYKKEKSESK